MCIYMLMHKLEADNDRPIAIIFLSSIMYCTTLSVTTLKLDNDKPTRPLYITVDNR